MFEIIIKEKIVEKKITGKDWACLKEIKGDSQYGYTPEIEKQIETERVIFNQKIEKINLENIIKAINNIK